VAVIALTLVASAACGTTETPVVAPPSTPAATAPPVTRDEAADQQIARDALLQVDDLPGTWNETKRSLSSEAEPSTTDSPIETCPEAKALAHDLGIDKTPKAVSAKSSKFDDGGGLSSQVDETVEITATVDEATSMANVFGDDAMLDCVKAALEEAFTKDPSKTITVDASKIKVERSKVGKLGDDHAVFLITLPMTSKGLSISVTAVVAFVRVGRGYVNLSYVSPLGVDMDKDVMPILTIAAQKLKKAQQN